MRWRCPECGKPHERNDPPCDNCGHHKLENAIVPQASRDDNYEQLIWVCSNCGRQHQRNNPPCSRCGNHELEKQTLDYGDVDPGDTPGYLDLVGRTEIGLALVVLALVSALTLGFLGIITIPGVTPTPPPTVEDVPGNNVSVASVQLADAERELLSEFDIQRERPLARQSDLDAVSAFITRQSVKNQFTDDDREITSELLRRFEIECSGSVVPVQASTGPIGSDATPESVAASLADSFGQASLTASNENVVAVGVHLHAGPDDRIYATATYCQNR